MSSQTLGRNNDQVREHNLAAILTLLSQSKSLSRSELVELSGLNRSTISVLMTELQAFGLVSETSPDETPKKGRPSFVASLSSEVAVFGVNVESSFTDVCLVSLRGEIMASHRIATPELPAPEGIIAQIKEAISTLKSAQDDTLRIAGIGVAVPGQVRVADGQVRLAPHLQWVEVPFANLLEMATGMPVYLGNNASLGAIAEHSFGAAKGFDEVVYLYGGSSGIGGGVIVRGELLRGTAGYAGELGHVVLSDSSREDYSGFHGTLEASLHRGDADASARASADALENQCRLLGAAISSFANIFNPQVILLGGFLGSIFAKAEEMVTGFALERILGAPAENLKIMRAELGSTQIIKGAAGLPISALIQAPKASSAIL